MGVVVRVIHHARNDPLVLDL